MPHFSKDVLDAAPETLAALREILHGRQSGGRTGRTTPSTPTKEGRFGAASGGGETPVRKRRPTVFAGM